MRILKFNENQDTTLDAISEAFSYVSDNIKPQDTFQAQKVNDDLYQAQIILKFKSSFSLGDYESNLDYIRSISNNLKLSLVNLTSDETINIISYDIKYNFDNIKAVFDVFLYNGWVSCGNIINGGYYEIDLRLLKSQLSTSGIFGEPSLKNLTIREIQELCDLAKWPSSEINYGVFLKIDGGDPNQLEKIKSILDNLLRPIGNKLLITYYKNAIYVCCKNLAFRQKNQVII